MAVAFVAGDAVGLATGHWQGAAWAWLAVALLWLTTRYIHRVERLQGFFALLLVFASGWLGAATAMDRRSEEVTQLTRCASARSVTVCGLVEGDVTLFPLANGSSACRFALREVDVCDGATTSASRAGSGHLVRRLRSVWRTVVPARHR